eukprot:4490376-Pleurochrysis_carterae.AAC.1
MFFGQFLHASVSLTVRTSSALPSSIPALSHSRARACVPVPQAASLGVLMQMALRDAAAAETAERKGALVLRRTRGHAETRGVALACGMLRVVLRVHVLERALAATLAQRLE